MSHVTVGGSRSPTPRISALLCELKPRPKIKTNRESDEFDPSRQRGFFLAFFLSHFTLSLLQSHRWAQPDVPGLYYSPFFHLCRHAMAGAGPTSTNTRLHTNLRRRKHPYTGSTASSRAGDKSVGACIWVCREDLTLSLKD